MAAEEDNAATGAEAGAAGRKFTVVADLEGNELREIGDEAEWILSSSKPGFGAANLRDNDMSTFWQSDALTPHVLVLSFPRRVRIVRIAMYIDAGKDDSYTPEVIRVKAGTSERDARHVTTLDLQPPPQGWVVVPLHHEQDGAKPLRAYTVQLHFERMMHAGKDLHVRQLRVYAPRSDAVGGTQHHPASSRYRSLDFLSYAAIR